MKTVLFLCTGNYYRSRFAEVLFNWHSRERGTFWRADSRGLQLDSYNPGPVSRHTLVRLQELGISCDSLLRFPEPLTEGDLARADHVVAVKEAEHRSMIDRNFPGWRDRIEFWHIHDIDVAAPRDALPLLQAEVLRLVRRLHEPPASG